MEFEDLSAAEYVVTYKGDGIYDSVKVIYPGEGAAPPQIQTDKLLFGKTLISNRRGDYYTAIEKAKELVNNHGSSQYLYSALDELYMAYKGMDTSSSGTNSLFAELQSYIEAKMQQYQNNLNFTDKAYNIYLMCLVKRKQYSEAIAGYENIMNNHPDPVARLSASWDRSAVVLLMGQGGSQSSLSFLRSARLWRGKQESRLSDRNPDKIARKMYKFANAESENGTSPEKYTAEEKSLIIDRAGRFNPSTKTEFEEKVSQDKALLLGLNKDASENSKDINIPKRFTLRQNYPNPFNPTTTIKYDIPKDAFVTLKVYDVLGREVFSVNEFKKAGSYETLFDGSGFASGVYFYSLEANGLKETKKMLMVK